MLKYIACSHKGCMEKATYKVAASWSDGRFRELKSYGLACQDHVGDMFREAVVKCKDTVRAPGEVIEPVGIYKFREGLRDTLLERLWGLEETYREKSEI